MSVWQSATESLPQRSAKKCCRYFLTFATAPCPCFVSERCTTRSSSAERLRTRYPFRCSPPATLVSVPGVTPSFVESFDIGVGAARKSNVKRILSCWGVSTPADLGRVWPRRVSCCIICSKTPASSAPEELRASAGAEVAVFMDLVVVYNSCIYQVQLRLVAIPRIQPSFTRFLRSFPNWSGPTSLHGEK